MTDPGRDPDQCQRVRQLIRRIAARAPLFRGVLRAHRDDLAALVALTGTEAANVFARMDGLDRDITDLLYWASGGEHDAHATKDGDAASVS
jgi:hypothetical protein